MCGGLHLGGYLAKILSFKSGNLLYKLIFYLMSEATVQLVMRYFQVLLLELDLLNFGRLFIFSV